MSKTPPKPSATLDRLRALCLSLPATGEKASWGHPNFTVSGKIFASYGDYDGEPTVGLKTSKERQAELCRTPRYYVAPYVGKHGWVCLRAGLPFEWSELEALVRDSYRRIAPKNLLRDLERLERPPEPVRTSRRPRAAGLKRRKPG